MQLAEHLPGISGAASQVSFVLSRVLLDDQGAPVDETLVHQRMSIGDRQFLMRELAKKLGLMQHWYSVQCQFCQSHFDFQLDPAELPVKPAGEDYPLAQVDTSTGTLRIRVPTAEDQVFASQFYFQTEHNNTESKFTQQEKDRALSRNLAMRLIQTGNNNGMPDLSLLNEQDIAQIETRAEAMSPELTQVVQTQCIECHETNNVFIDPYACLPELTSTDVLTQIHQIASVYHWSEQAILSMPKNRRQQYLNLISQSSGVRT